MRDADRRLGAWETEIGDPVAKKEVGRARMEFYPDGTPAYITIEGERRQVIRLTDSVVGDKLVTDQPAYLNPQETQETRFEISGQFLHLFYGTSCGSFKKGR
jgi:hypothetical protein